MATNQANPWVIILGQAWKDMWSNLPSALSQASICHLSAQTLELPSPALSLRALDLWQTGVNGGQRVRVTPSRRTWGCRDRGLWDSVGLVSALVTGKKCCSCIKGCCDDRGSCAVLKFHTCPLTFQQRPWCSPSCQVLNWSKCFHTLVSFFSMSCNIFWMKHNIVRTAWSIGSTQWSIAVTQTEYLTSSPARGFIL